MKGLGGLISKPTLKEASRTAIIMIISFGYGALGTSYLVINEYQKEIDRLRKYIKSGKAGKYGESRKAKRNWDTEIPPMGYNPDDLTEI